MPKAMSPADPQWTPARPTLLGRVLLATGVAALGIQSLIHADFVSALEPVPAWLPMRRAWACLIAACLVISAVGHLSKRHLRSAAIGLGAMCLLWLLVFHVPRLVARPTSMSAWVVACETAALMGAAWVLAGMLSVGGKVSRGGIAIKAAVAGRILFGLSLLLFGLSHFMYHDFVATLVPAWIPGRLFWAYFTGAAHVAAGVSLLTNVLARLAAALYGLMIGLFALLVNAPRAVTFNKPAEWDSLFVAVALSGAAWIIAGCLQQPRSSTAADPTAAT